MLELMLGNQSGLEQYNGTDLFLGEVSAGDFLTGAQLSTLTGVNTGTLAKDSDLTWLKFRLDQKVIYVTRSNVRYSTRWDVLKNLGVVYGEKVIAVNDRNYRVRLLKGDVNDPSYYSDGISISPQSDFSEWGRTIMQVAASYIGGTALWAAYTADQLNIHGGTGGGSWMQEKWSDNSLYCLIRGAPSIGRLVYRPQTDSIYRNWRAVLELVD